MALTEYVIFLAAVAVCVHASVQPTPVGFRGWARIPFGEGGLSCSDTLCVEGDLDASSVQHYLKGISVQNGTTLWKILLGKSQPLWSKFSVFGEVVWFVADLSIGKVSSKGSLLWHHELIDTSNAFSRVYPLLGPHTTQSNPKWALLFRHYSIVNITDWSSGAMQTLVSWKETNSTRELLASPPTFVPQRQMAIVPTISGSVIGMNLETGKRVFIRQHAIPHDKSSAWPLVAFLNNAFFTWNGTSVLSMRIADGTLIWSTPSNVINTTSVTNIGIDPVTHTLRVVAGTKFFVLNPSDGSSLGTVKFNQPFAFHSEYLHNNRSTGTYRSFWILVNEGSDFIAVSVDPATSLPEIKWQSLNYFVVGTPVLPGQVISGLWGNVERHFVVSGYCYTLGKYALTLIRADTGERIVEFIVDTTPHFVAVGGNGSVLVYHCNCDSTGLLWLPPVDPRTNELVPASTFTLPGDIAGEITTLVMESGPVYILHTATQFFGYRVISEPAEQSSLMQLWSIAVPLHNCSLSKRNPLIIGDRAVFFELVQPVGHTVVLTLNNSSPATEPNMQVIHLRSKECNASLPIVGWLADSYDKSTAYVTNKAACMFRFDLTAFGISVSSSPPLKDVHSLTSPPAVSHDAVFAQTDTRDDMLVRLSKSTFSTGANSVVANKNAIWLDCEAPPFYARGSLFFISMTGHLLGYNATTLAGPTWDVAIPDAGMGVCDAPAVLHDDALFAGASRAIGIFTWNSSAVPYLEFAVPFSESNCVNSPPVFARPPKWNTTVGVVVQAFGGVYAFDCSNGSVLWHLQHTDGCIGPPVVTPFYTLSVCVARDDVYLFIFDTATGQYPKRLMELSEVAAALVVSDCRTEVLLVRMHSIIQLLTKP